ncbi:MAG: glycosyltransferase [Planctomycetota bacterium]|nr:glycosyltransferase [Planctomycetota bacterium]
MKITILALGTRGDVQPYVALGEGLRKVGHGVRVATFENFEPLVTGLGLQFHPVAGDVQSILASESVLDLIEPRGKTGIRNLLHTGKAWVSAVQACAQALWEACHGTDAIINGLPGALFGFDAAERLHVPHVSAAVIPFVRTRSFPIPVLPPASFGSAYNLLTYRIAEQVLWRTVQGTINQWRQGSLGLPKAPFWGHSSRLNKERVLVLNGFSPRLVPRPPDWPGHIFITGYWFLEERDWRPPPELLDFIESGPKPVFVGFGSMPVRHPERMANAVVDALRRSGHRGVLGMGWGGVRSGDLPDDMVGIEYAPYSWLFPRMAAVMHHGGSGSTAAGLHAGVPSVVVPFLLDQFYWGRRIASLGVGPKPIPRNQLSVKRMASAIRRATSDPDMRRRARELGRAVRTEHGVVRAVEVLDSYLTDWSN